MKKYASQEMNELLSSLKEIFDVVRLTAPMNAREIEIGEDGNLSEGRPCFDLLHIQENCENCISMQAYLQKRRAVKYEVADGQIFSVIAVPVTVVSDQKEKELTLELININTPGHWLKQVENCPSIDKLINEDKKIYVDSLTKAYNRRYYDERIFLREKAIRKSTTLSVVFADLHDFKHINDTYGHPVGDDVLVRAVSLIKKSIRREDVLVRMGGDEFLLFLPDVSTDEAKKIVIRIHRAFAKELYVTPTADVFVAVDMGLARSEKFSFSDEEIERLRSMADAEMYRNKRLSYLAVSPTTEY